MKSADEMRAVFKELPEAYRTRWRWPSGATSTLDVRPVPPAAVPGARRLHARLVPRGAGPRGPARALRRVPGRRGGGAAPLRAAASSRRWASPATSSWCGTSSRYARRQGIAVGPGRGSSAGSLVAYCLGITNVDPIRYGLLFERFLNPERISMPDMDIDFADDRRDEVIRYVVDRYGADRVAHIITFGTMGAKAVHPRRGARARLLLRRGRPHRQAGARLPAQHHARRVAREGRRRSRSRSSASQRWASCGTWPRRSRAARATPPCTPPRSSSRTSRSMERVPLYKDPKRPELITGYAMGPIEKLGLLKMDFLGLKTLTVIANAVRAASRSRAGSSSTATRCRSTTPGPTSSSPRRAPSASSSWSRRACGTRSAASSPSASRTSSPWWRSTARARWT